MWPSAGSAVFSRMGGACQAWPNALGQSSTRTAVRCCSLRRWQTWTLPHCQKMVTAALHLTLMRYVRFVIIMSQLPYIIAFAFAILVCRIQPVLVLQLSEEQQMSCPGMELNLPGELAQDNVQAFSCMHDFMCLVALCQVNPTAWSSVMVPSP